MHVDARAFHLVRRPRGLPDPADFRLLTQRLDPASLRSTAPETLLVENLYFSVDPFHRRQMDEAWDLHSPLEAGTVARVLVSTGHTRVPGDLVFHRQGYASHALVPASRARLLPLRPGIGPETYLGILGGTGLTAYAGLTLVGGLRAGQSVFITAAGGGVGSAAGHIARLVGASRIVGITGTERRVRRLLAGGGFDTVVNHSDARALARLRADSEGRFDIALAGVGGRHLGLAIDMVRARGVIAWVGARAQYTRDAPPAAPHNLRSIVEKQLRLEGFRGADRAEELRDSFESLVVPALRDGSLAPELTIINGLENAPAVLQGFYTGDYDGTVLIRLDPATV